MRKERHIDLLRRMIITAKNDLVYVREHCCDPIIEQLAENYLAALEGQLNGAEKDSR